MSTVHCWALDERPAGATSAIPHLTHIPSGGTEGPEVESYSPYPRGCGEGRTGLARGCQGDLALTVGESRKAPWKRWHVN